MALIGLVALCALSPLYDQWWRSLEHERTKSTATTTGALEPAHEKMKGTASRATVEHATSTPKLALVTMQLPKGSGSVAPRNREVLRVKDRKAHVLSTQASMGMEPLKVPFCVFSY